MTVPYIELKQERNLSPLDTRHLAIERLLRDKTWTVPFEKDIYLLRPDIQGYIDPQDAVKKGSVHGQEHVADGLIIGLPFWQKLALMHPMLHLPVESIAQAWTIHDLRVSTYENYPDHGLHVVELFEREKRHVAYGKQWELIKYIVTHHSDKVNDTVVEEAIQKEKIRTRMALAGLQDVDASLLMRAGANVPIQQIMFRTELAARLQLPYVAYALLEEAKNVDTGDSFRDHVVAGICLGLVKPDPVTVYEQT
jgi:hypothetical protein